MKKQKKMEEVIEKLKFNIIQKVWRNCYESK